MEVHIYLLIHSFHKYFGVTYRIQGTTLESRDMTINMMGKLCSYLRPNRNMSAHGHAKPGCPCFTLQCPEVSLSCNLLRDPFSHVKPGVQHRPQARVEWLFILYYGWAENFIGGWTKTFNPLWTELPNTQEIIRLISSFCLGWIILLWPQNENQEARRRKRRMLLRHSQANLLNVLV